MYNIHVQYQYTFHRSICMFLSLLEGNLYISTEWSLTIQGSKSFHVFATDAGLESDFTFVSMTQM